MSEVIIDVRERDEYLQQHVQNSIKVPLSVFTAVVPGVLNQLRDREIRFMCRGGARATQAHKHTSKPRGLGSMTCTLIRCTPVVSWPGWNPVKGCR